MLASVATADWIGTGAAVATAIAAIVGFWFAVRGLRLSARANVSTSYAEVTGGMSNIGDFFKEHTELLRYFYFDVELTPEEKEKHEVNLELACERIVEFADALVEQRRAVPEADMDWSTWEVYFRFLYQQKSSLLREYLLENMRFYPDYTLSVFGFIVVRDEHTGVVESVWDTADRENTGYPWLGTWELRAIEPPERHDKVLVKIAPDRRSGVAKVTLEWDGPPDVDAEPFLYSWAVGLLQGSSRLRVAYVDRVSRGRTEFIGRVRLTRGIRLVRFTRRERFLAPVLPIRRPPPP